MVQQRRHAPGSAKSWHVSPVLDLDPYSGPSDLSVLPKVLVYHSTTETSSFDPYWGEKEQTVSAPVTLVTGTMLDQIPGIPAFAGNPTPYVEADGNRNMSSVLVGDSVPQ